MVAKDEVAAAKAAAARLQDAADGGTPVAIPGGFGPGQPPLPENPNDGPPLPVADDEKDDRRLEGGGKLIVRPG